MLYLALLNNYLFRIPLSRGKDINFSMLLADKIFKTIVRYFKKFDPDLSGIIFIVICDKDIEILVDLKILMKLQCEIDYKALFDKGQTFSIA